MGLFNSLRWGPICFTYNSLKRLEHTFSLGGGNVIERTLLECVHRVGRRSKARPPRVKHEMSTLAPILKRASAKH